MFEMMTSKSQVANIDPNWESYLPKVRTHKTLGAIGVLWFTASGMRRLEFSRWLRLNFWLLVVAVVTRCTLGPASQRARIPSAGKAGRNN